jgi:hypothetical protein
MITMLMGLGLGKRVAQLIAYVAVPLLVVLLLWWALDSYGDRRADEREAEVHATYKAASDRLKEQAAQSATKADDAAAVRLGTHQQQVQQEMEAIDEARRKGSSPLNVLFGTNP